MRRSRSVSPPSPSPLPSLREECGLVAPRPARWLADRHWLLALAAAVPVWLALALWAGPQMRAPAGAWAWASLVVVQPLLEELVLRGVLQGQLLRLTRARRWGPVSVANALTSAVFVALHLPAQPLAWALAVAAPSLVFGHLRERFASVWPAVALHALYNLGFGAAAALAR
jgi:membrane protease YdiL (CAAX protease family)